MAIRPKQSAVHSVDLTEDEIYTLQLLLAYVAGDEQAYDTMFKFEELIGECSDDYGLVKFEQDEDGDYTIKIKKESN